MAWWRKQSAQTPRWSLEDDRTAFTATSKAQIEQGVAPWQQPGKPGARRLPENLRTGKPYRGGNAVYLSVTAEEKGYTDTRWATYKQIQELGGQVRTGEKSTKVFFSSLTTSGRRSRCPAASRTTRRPVRRWCGSTPCFTSNKRTA